MARQTTAKKPEQFGKGKVTPVQIAYIVDQYLSENLFTQTRSSFRSEASSLISKTPLQEGPKGLMSLEAIINEYVSMKEQKLAIEMEKRRLEQESFRVQSLLQGLQNVMNAYNASSAPLTAASSVPVIPSTVCFDFCVLAGQLVKASTHTALAPNASRRPTSFTTSQVVVNPCSKKRQASSIVPCAPTNAKKSRTRMPTKQLSDGNSQQSLQQPDTLPSSTNGCVANVLFCQTTSTTSATQNSSGPVTPPQAPSAPSDKSVSPVGHSSSTNSITPADFESNCTIVSTKTVIVSPFKQATYYSVEKHCSATCSPAKGDLQRSVKRDRVKGRLNFDGADDTASLEKSTANDSSTSESADGNFHDLDLSILDFDISDLLLDFDMHCEELDAHAPHPQVIVSSPDLRLYLAFESEMSGS
ncbi:hypothetical protein QQ045_016689 [Rhodiola kirilowii]